jgi:apolipoprotein N-acyltransferase
LRLRPLAWLALAPFFVALARAGPRRALLLGWIWGVVAAYLVGQWLPRAVSGYYEQPPLVGVAFFLGVATTMVAPYTIAFAVAYNFLARHRRATALLVAAAWTAAELGRGRLFTGTPFFIGNPWALLGYSQMGWPPIVQIAAVTGVYGVTFALAALNAALAACWLRWRDGLWSSQRGTFGILAATIPAAAALAYGLLTLARAPNADARIPATRVAVVQRNLDMGQQWNRDHYGRNLEAYLRSTAAAISSENPAVVFWPEAAMTFFLESEPLYRQAIAGVLTPTGTQLVAGGPTVVNESRAIYRNSIFLLSPVGSTLGRYDKQYLVPFAEYFPITGLDFLRRRFERVRVFTPGVPTAPLPTAAGPLGVLVCNEAMLPEIAGRRVAEGAAYLVNPSNDSWLDDRTYSSLQFDIVAMRAIEQRRYLVRASTSGPSAIVDPWGRVQAHTEPLTSGMIAGTVRPRLDVSIYGRLGDAFGLLCLAGVLIGLVAAAGQRRVDPPSRSESRAGRKHRGEGSDSLPPSATRSDVARAHGRSPRFG